MKIINKQIENTLNAYKIVGQRRTNAREKTSRTKQVSGNQESMDTLTLSDNVWEYQIAHKSLSKTSVERIAKINEIKRKIDEGSYDVDGLLVAEQIIERFSVDKLI